MKTLLIFFFLVSCTYAHLTISKALTGPGDKDSPTLTACHVWFPSRMRTELVAKQLGGPTKRNKPRFKVYAVPKWEPIKGGWRCYQAKLDIPSSVPYGAYSLRVRGVSGKVYFKVGNKKLYGNGYTFYPEDEVLIDRDSHSRKNCGKNCCRAMDVFSDCLIHL